MNIVRVADTHCWTGEGPVWHAEERALYWLDIPEGRLYRYDPGTETPSPTGTTEPSAG